MPHRGDNVHPPVPLTRTTMSQRYHARTGESITAAVIVGGSRRITPGFSAYWLRRSRSAVRIQSKEAGDQACSMGAEEWRICSPETDISGMDLEKNTRRFFRHETEPPATLSGRTQSSWSSDMLASSRRRRHRRRSEFTGDTAPLLSPTGPPTPLVSMIGGACLASRRPGRPASTASRRSNG